MVTSMTYSSSNDSFIAEAISAACPRLGVRFPENIFEMCDGEILVLRAISFTRGGGISISVFSGTMPRSVTGAVPGSQY